MRNAAQRCRESTLRWANGSRMARSRTSRAHQVGVCALNARTCGLRTAATAKRRFDRIIVQHVTNAAQ
eukprot:7946012-Lingulodinium_polyedra.AAC.1